VARWAARVRRAAARIAPGARRQPAGTPGIDGRGSRGGQQWQALLQSPSGAAEPQHPAGSETGSSAGVHPVADIALSSPAIGRTGDARLSSRYTYAGANQSPLHWSGMPAGTRELVLFVISERPQKRQALLRLGCETDRPEPGRTTCRRTALAGTVVGCNGYGHSAYSICPPAGRHEPYIFELFALPRSLAPA